MRTLYIPDADAAPQVVGSRDLHGHIRYLLDFSDLGTPMGDCDNSTASSDCDYRNSGCSTEPWEMTIVDVDNEEDDDELTELTYEETTQDCHYHTCISCLQPSGFSTNSTEPTDPEPTKRRRRRREISSHGKKRTVSA